MVKGTVLLSWLNVMPTPGGTPVLFQLKSGDKIEALDIVNGWWRITKVTRGTNIIKLPSQLCYAYQGLNNLYIRLDSTEIPPIDPTDPAAIGYPDYLIVQVPNPDGTLQPPVQYARVPK